jgi:hydroxymethylpyrimidine pyrophosphatase-like HAD family hydrolase
LQKVNVVRTPADRRRFAERCAGWGVAPEEVLAIGDSRNDLPMLEWAGTGVAMSWSPDSVKVRADWVTSDGNKAGMAEAIDKFVLGDKASEAFVS